MDQCTPKCYSHCTIPNLRFENSSLKFNAGASLRGSLSKLLRTAIGEPRRMAVCSVSHATQNWGRLRLRLVRPRWLAEMTPLVRRYRIPTFQKLLIAVWSDASIVSTIWFSELALVTVSSTTMINIVEKKTPSSLVCMPKFHKNSSGDEIANVNFYAVRPEATRKKPSQLISRSVDSSRQKLVD